MLYICLIYHVWNNIKYLFEILYYLYANTEFESVKKLQCRGITSALLWLPLPDTCIITPYDQEHACAKARTHRVVFVGFLNFHHFPNKNITNAVDTRTVCAAAGNIICVWLDLSADLQLGHMTSASCVCLLHTQLISSGKIR